MCREGAGLGRQPQGYDQIAKLKHALALRRLAGQAIECLQCNLTPAGSTLDFDDSVERYQGHAEVRRMGGDAGFAPAEHGVQPILAATGVATAARLTLVAGAGAIIKISAARSL